MRSHCKLLTAVLLALMTVLAPRTMKAAMQPVHAAHAMVVSVHGLASQAGVDILRQGGNAVDAAVATGFALAVVHPQAGNIGGGGFMLVRLADGAAHFIDYREKAPAKATRDMYLDAQGNIIPGASTIGYKAIGVPGSVAGMVYAEKKYGKLKLAEVMAPAIRLARDGFPLSWAEADEMRDPELAKFPASRHIFQRDGNYYQAGEIFRQPQLAATLGKIAANPDDFYHGDMARQIASAVEQGGGLITAQDLARYEVKERSPIHGTYRGYEIISAPPPSSGGIALVEALKILEGYDLSALGSHSAEAIHLTVEAFRRAFFDRAEFLGDPDFAQIPVAQLVDKKYGRAWRASLNPHHASDSRQLKRPAEFLELERYARQHAQPLAVREPEHTTHYSVVDAEGTTVSVTTTLNDSFGSRVTVPGLGFLLNDEMDDFTSKPGAPNLYGLIQSPNNAIGPEKRPLSAMTPTIVLKDGKLFLVLGSPGGPRIITTVANILMGVVDYGMNIQEAVDAPRFHHQWMPDTVYLEKGFSPDTIKLLQDMGHKLTVQGYWSDGECIEIDPQSGERWGATDVRNVSGQAIGY
ncbi:MAG TPA: gamma-glutamyltransferase [Terriglobales bacterium]|nr:gamma-glutamyltransferase [Terriglobales bacterium]